MKKLIYFFTAITLFFTACTTIYQGKIKEVDDEFKNIKTISYTQYLFPVERITPISNAIVTYYKEKNDSTQKFSAYFVISRSSNSFPVENKVYMKIDGKTYEFEINQQKSEYKSFTSTKTSTTTTKDSTKVSTTNSSNTELSQWYDDKFVIHFSDELVNSMLNAKVILYRMYFGPEIVTYKVEYQNISRLKEMLNK